MDQCRRRIYAVGYLRLGVGAIFFVMVYLAFLLHWFSGWFVLIPLLAFIALLGYHDSLYRQGNRALRAVTFYERGLARIEDRWAGSGNSDVSFADETHLYAADLDLFGKGSLFELLSAARTRSGERTLARWLCAPADREEILRRQEAIAELRDNVDLREDLSVLADDVRTAVDSEFLGKWATDPSRLPPSRAAMVAPLLAAMTVGGLIYWAISGSASFLFLIAVPLQAAFGLFYRKRVGEMMAVIDDRAKELRVLYLVLRRLDREHFSSAELRQLRARIQATGQSASRQIESLLRLLELMNSRRNEFFAIFAAVLLGGTQLLLAIDSWRRRCGADLAGWLEAVGAMEALCSLAGYAFEHPADPFPVIVEEPNCVELEEARHPLLPHDQCIPNSLRLGGALQLLVVSGSNMSGKSTLLRTVGINVVLAQAGAPVRARSMKLSLLEIGATLRVQDSLQGGTSRFYAEIRRLHDVMQMAEGRRPVLFLFDEILHGTNSHDRAIGAEAVVRGLVERGAIGLVTTHDLALAKVAEALAPRAANVHFEDHLENGRMVFDYVLRPGIVEKSNALELMRAVGLKV